MAAGSLKRVSIHYVVLLVKRSASSLPELAMCLEGRRVPGSERIELRKFMYTAFEQPILLCPQNKDAAYTVA
jgi:hypothetical protein